MGLDGWRQSNAKLLKRLAVFAPRNNNNLLHVDQYHEVCDHDGHDKPSKLPLQILRSAAGYYTGYFCPQCGPYARLSGYYQTREEAYDDWEGHVPPEKEVAL